MFEPKVVSHEGRKAGKGHIPTKLYEGYGLYPEVSSNDQIFILETSLSSVWSEAWRGANLKEGRSGRRLTGDGGWMRINVHGLESWFSGS